MLHSSDGRALDPEVIGSKPTSAKYSFANFCHFLFYPGGFGAAPSQPVTTQQQPRGVDLLGGFAPAPSVAAQPQMMTRQPPQTQQTAPSTDWGDFTSAQ